MRPPDDNGPPADLTLLLREASEGGREAFDRVLPLVYAELKRIARSRLGGQRPGHTLTPTALVHEAYLKLVDHTDVEWESRLHFFAIASSAMRQILIDHAKRRRAARRGGGAVHVSFEDALDGDGWAMDGPRADGLLALDEALTRLAEFDERGATVVQYRFFGGLGHREVADVLGVSEVTVRRAWAAAKAWLRQELERGEVGPGSLGAEAGPA